jgi:hypothetical protein
VPFFILDTRCERTPRSGATAARAEILGRQQFVALETWLFKRRDDGRPKFVVSPSVFLPRHSHAVCTGSSASAIRSDGWCGYPAQFSRLLAHIARHRITNVVFLCGDAHLCCITKAKLQWNGGPPTIVHSIVSSPLYAPYPFANMKHDGFVGAETFAFSLPKAAALLGSCELETRFLPRGDGFALLRTTACDGDWKLSVEFDLTGAAAMESRYDIALERQRPTVRSPGVRRVGT